MAGILVVALESYTFGLLERWKRFFGQFEISHFDIFVGRGAGGGVYVFFCTFCISVFVLGDIPVMD